MLRFKQNIQQANLKISQKCTRKYTVVVLLPIPYFFDFSDGCSLWSFFACFSSFLAFSTSSFFFLICKNRNIHRSIVTWIQKEQNSQNATTADRGIFFWSATEYLHEISSEVCPTYPQLMHHMCGETCLMLLWMNSGKQSKSTNRVWPKYFLAA